MFIRLSFFAALAMTAMPAVAAEPAWPQFRGVHGDGTSTGSPPVQIGPGKNVAWKVEVPSGFSSPVIVGDKLILTAFDGGKLYTIAYSRADGKELWRAHAPAKEIEPYHKTEASPAASTPVSDGERIISYFGSAGLFCYNLAGKELWRYEMVCAKTNNDFGTGVSPILADGLVILSRDLSKDSTLYAIDAKTGSLVWEKKRDGFATSYGSPVIWNTPTGKELIVPGSFKLVSYDPKTGAEKWNIPGLAAVNCTVPVVAENGNLIYAAWSPGGNDFKMPTFDELLKQTDKNGDEAVSAEEAKDTPFGNFFSNNDTNKDGKITRDEWDAQIKFLTTGKNSAIAVKPGGKGDISNSHVAWKVTKGIPYVPSPLVYLKQMYVLNMRGMLSVYDVETGKDVYLEENIGLTGIYASPVAANGHVYVFGLDGTAIVLKAGGDLPEVVSRAKFGERVAATPAIVGDTIYVRTAKNLYAFAGK